jgi:CRP-like cAMP-binding protein
MAANRAAIELFFGALPLFADLKRREIRRLALTATECVIARGAVLFRQGGPCTGLHLVTVGQVKICLQTPHGDEKVIELVGPGSCLGIKPLVLRESHLTSAEAITDCTLVQLGRDAVVLLLQREPVFALSMLTEACRRLGQRTRDLEHCLLFDGKQRVTDFLLGQLPLNGMAGKQAVVTLSAKKSIIASRLNLTQEHFSRVLRDIHTAGLIEVRGRQIRLVDIARLRHYLSPERERDRHTTDG